MRSASASPRPRRWAAAGWMALASLAVAASPARALAPAAVDVSVDATASGAPLAPVWAFHGYDEINYTTTAEGRALLGTLAAAHTAPVHVRTHFLFNSGDGTPALKWGSTNVYTEDGAGNPLYSWTITDGITDAITAAGAFPFVELGFMPQALSTHAEPYRNSEATALDGGCFYPPADYTKWAALVRAWAAHAQERHPAQVDRWLWELWNEPDIGYWRGTFDEYAALYDHTEAALHGVLPDAPLGGPAVAGAAGSFLRQFLEHCATGTNAVTGQLGTRLDLVTFHAKGGTAFAGDHVQMNLGSQLRQHRAGFDAVAAYPQFRQTPIYITEADPDGCAACPASTMPSAAYRNSPAYGAYELAMMKHTVELGARSGIVLGGVLTWAFTFPGTPYFAGYRELATNGIELPVLGAFRLLGRLAGRRVPLTSTGARPLDDVLANGVRGEAAVDGMAAVDGDSVRVLTWSYHDDVVAGAATPVRLTVTVPASFGPHVRVSHLRVDETHGDAYAVWLAQGSPPEPSAAQVAALRQAMEPSPLRADELRAVPASGVIQLAFELPRFAVSLVTVVPAAAGDAGTESSGCRCAAGGDGEPSAAALLVISLLAGASRARRRGGYARVR